MAEAEAEVSQITNPHVSSTYSTVRTTLYTRQASEIRSLKNTVSTVYVVEPPLNRPSALLLQLPATAQAKMFLRELKKGTDHRIYGLRSIID